MSRNILISWLWSFLVKAVIENNWSYGEKDLAVTAAHGWIVVCFKSAFWTWNTSYEYCHVSPWDSQQKLMLVTMGVHVSVTTLRVISSCHCGIVINSIQEWLLYLTTHMLAIHMCLWHCRSSIVLHCTSVPLLAWFPHVFYDSLH